MPSRRSSPLAACPVPMCCGEAPPHHLMTLRAASPRSGSHELRDNDKKRFQEQKRHEGRKWLSQERILATYRIGMAHHSSFGKFLSCGSLPLIGTKCRYLLAVFLC